MAALDFPNPPLTVGQLYNGTNGVTYQWDGTVWTVPVGGAQLWSVSGSNLTPVDATKYVSVPGGAGAIVPAVILGSGTAKARVQGNNGAPGNVILSANRDWAANAQDDATKPSWGMFFRLDTDQCQIQRSPAGSTTQASLLTVDSAGKLILPGDSTGNVIVTGTRTQKQRVIAHPGQDACHFTLNAILGAAAWSQDDVSKPSWI